MPSQTSQVQPLPKRFTPPSLIGGAQLVERAERVLDRRAQRTAGLAASVRAHDLPEQRVVGVAAGVVADRGLLVLGERVEVREHLLDGGVRELRSLERGVRVRHVGAVVEVVVDAHRLGVDVRLERVVGVRQVGQFEGHLGGSFVGSALLRAEDMLRARVHARLQVRGDRPAPAAAGGLRARRDLPRVGRGALQAVRGLRRASGTRSSASWPTPTSPPRTRSSPSSAR